MISKHQSFYDIWIVHGIRLFNSSLFDERTRALNSNQFSGRIPASLGSLSNLDYLDLADNQLTGTLPTSASEGSGLDQLVNTQHLWDSSILNEFCIQMNILILIINFSTMCLTAIWTRIIYQTRSQAICSAPIWRSYICKQQRHWYLLAFVLALSVFCFLTIVCVQTPWQQQSHWGNSRVDRTCSITKSPVSVC